jgi:DNA-binding MarR family transcriptional regulator
MPAKDRSEARKRPSRRPPSVEARRELIDLLFAAAATLRQNFATVAGDFDLSPLQARALACLDPGDPVSMRELATAVGCDASTMTDIIDRLEGMRLVERRPDRVDRRVTGIAITPAGLATKGRLFPKVLADAPVSRLAPDEQARLRELLIKMLGPDAPPPGRAGPPPMPVERPHD